MRCYSTGGGGRPGDVSPREQARCEKGVDWGTDHVCVVLGLLHRPKVKIIRALFIFS